MNASHPIPGAPSRRVRAAPEAGLDSLEPAAAKRFRVALVCLIAGYALAWIEIPLEFPIPPGETAAAEATALAAAIVARVLLGVLYLFVALGRSWARWTAVALGFLSALIVAPMLPGVWHVFPLASLVTGIGAVCKLAAAVLLMLPMRARRVSP